MNDGDLTPIRYKDGKLTVLDQTLLPTEERWITLECKEDVYDAIKNLRVRGAPAIGIAAAYGICVSLAGSGAASYGELAGEFKEVKEHLLSSRPTAANLFWALDRMEQKLKSVGDEFCFVLSLEDEKDFIIGELLSEAEAIKKEDEDACTSMGLNGLKLFEELAASAGNKNAITVLTHCNAGALATSHLGTSLAPVYLAARAGMNIKVYADETRPLLQGARLTSWELSRAGIDVTLICDNMASTVMKQSKIDAVVVGCDRMAANGDGANKIGTSVLAILAKEYGIPFYMFAPTSTIDMDTACGDDILIEERDGEEICEMFFAKRTAPGGIKTYNPAFDVTDNKYITAIVTERGTVYPPYDRNLKLLFE